MDYTVTGMLVAAVTGMSSVVTFLYRQIMSTQADMKTKLDLCSAQHEEAHNQILAISVQLAELKGKQDGIREFGERVIEIVKERNDQ